ncbi:MAG: mechanosensitive ion channel [Pseudomonadota bacterium]|nr:mechanosensitive ion channel [Pseudomonadota bacterium]
MRFPRFLLPGLLSWLLTWLLVGAAAAQGGVADKTADATVAGGEPVTIEMAESLIENAGTIRKDDTAGAHVLRTYQTSLELLRDEQRAIAEAENFQRILRTAGDETAALKQGLAQFAARQTPSPAESLRWRQLGRDELAHDLAGKKAGLVELQSRLAGIGGQITTLQARPAQLREDLAEAKDRLLSLQQTQQAEPAQDALGRARYFRNRAELQQITARIRKLSLENVSSGERLSLLTLQAQVLEAQIAFLEGAVEQIQSLLDAQLRTRGIQAREQASEISRQAANKHPLIQEAAQRNAALALKQGETSSLLEQTRLQIRSLRKMVTRMNREYRRTLAELELGGSSAATGQFLYRQRQSLADMIFSDVYNQRPSAIKRQLLAVQADQFAMEDEISALRDGEPSADSLVEKFAAANPDLDLLPKSERDQVRAELAKLLRDRVELLEQVGDGDEEISEVLQDLAQALKQVQHKGGEYAQFLSGKQWLVPSNPAIGVEWFTRLGAALKGLFSPALWHKGGEVLGDAWQGAPWLGTMLLLLIAGLLFQRRNLKQRLKAIAGEVGRFYSDRFSLTAKAMLITVLLALPLPLLIGGLHLLLVSFPGFSIRALVGYGLVLFGFHVFGVLLLDALFLPYGVAESHLRMKPETLAVTRRNLTWWTPVVIVGGAGIVLTRLHGGASQYYDTIGLLAFVVVALALAGFLWRTLQLRPANSVRQQQSGDEAETPRRLWVTVLCLFFVAVALAALAGYYYTAEQLATVVVDTMWVIGAGVLSYRLALRWQKLARSKLARARAWRRFEATRKEKSEREATEAAGEVMPELQEQMALDDVDARIKSLLRVVHILLVGAAVLWLWHKFFPVEALLDSVELWQRVAHTDSGERLVPVTLKHLLLALMIGALSWTVARNLPALMELVLEPIKLDAGNRYAATRLLVYVVYVVGLVLLMNTIGISWGDLQWLVAAMGVGLGFGLKEIFANLISGLILLFERPIRVGDSVTINNDSGVVSRIQMRATTITDFDNKELIIPNQTLIVEPVINWTLTDQVTRIKFLVGIAYGSDTEKALEVMTDTVSSCERVLAEPPPTIFFVEFGDSSLNFEVRVFVHERVNRMPVLHSLHMRLDKALRENGIEIPFPQRDLHLRSVEEGFSFAPPTPAGP